MNIKSYSFLLVFCLPFSLLGQEENQFTRQDSLRGSITPERAWWDLTYYDLDVSISPDERFIEGTNTVHYTATAPGEVLQIDLQPPMQLSGATQDGKSLDIRKEGNAHFISLKKKQKAGEKAKITLEFSGNPKVAVNAPWDGGFSWKQDGAGNPFIATSCQGLGASVWWPNKDHMYDEPDSMAISLTVPEPLVGVANGRLISKQVNGGMETYNWKVVNPINNYGVNANVANYVNFKDTYQGENGQLDLDYYVLPENLDKAREQFKQVPLMLDAFEHWFGPYPFYEDSFKLVEVPYLGMEHQSSVTYGNGYQNGYRGYDLSGSGWGLKFDFIIIHEAGHEWFANNITYKDAADMWIHEGFTAYSENLYLDYHFGSEAAAAYVIGTRANIQNDKPIIGQYDVNQEGSGDMYYKGANMLHTLRQLIEDDDLWRSILRGLNEEFYHKTVTTAQIENYISKASGKDLSAFFNQYLRTTSIPVLEYQQEGDELKFRYTGVVEDFDMPVRIFADGTEKWIFPDSQWKREKLPGTAVQFDPNFYVDYREAGK
ncbi:Peptidase family M1 [Robiginitalea myxolifaciens]|uniref:Peptidase family M1 n=1 Tax=Robiginitalea myxolifaciens TaxID=400055 RepID=A0A1I6FMS5_9FLAO|nr:M1 family metallopeptidase [Robiginitalea myxolifaciens]SFR31252.1 Peptidase family M1 [Robiginitalea myxolifaciens]